MAIDTVEDIKGLVGKNGLVILEFLEDYTPFAKGDKAGFYPKEALALFKNGTALFAQRPNIKPDTKPINPLAPYVSTSNVPTPEVSASPSANATEIPENWEHVHRLKKLHIAAKIRGIPHSDVGSEKDAENIIREEIARRARELRI